jgi:hypothetical protein
MTSCTLHLYYLALSIQCKLWRLIIEWHRAHYICLSLTHLNNKQHNGQKKKVQKDIQRSAKHTHKIKDRVTRTPLNTGGELRCSGRVSSSFSTSGTRRVNLVTNPVISHEWGEDWEVFTTCGTYPLSFVTQIFHNGPTSHDGDRKTFEKIHDLSPGS